MNFSNQAGNSLPVKLGSRGAGYEDLDDVGDMEVIGVRRIGRERRVLGNVPVDQRIVIKQGK